MNPSLLRIQREDLTSVRSRLRQSVHDSRLADDLRFRGQDDEKMVRISMRPGGRPAVTVAPSMIPETEQRDRLETAVADAIVDLLTVGVDLHEPVGDMLQAFDREATQILGGARDQLDARLDKVSDYVETVKERARHAQKQSRP
ncbi:hypothetical protein ACQBAR_13835 [Propionibacteriaceae bacterium Y1685]